MVAPLTQESFAVATREAWLEARLELLAREKELTRLRDEIARRRQALPWVRVDKPYLFDGPDGRETLADLFAGRSQLIVQHFMFAPEWEAGCKSCSFWADGYNGVVAHVQRRDATFVAVSRAPQAKLQAFAKRLGWSFKWLTTLDSFNYDFGVSFTSAAVASGRVAYNFGDHPAYGPDLPGVSVFAKRADGGVYHTYSCYARGLDTLNAAYAYIDLLPKGRDEADLAGPMAWVRLRDSYPA